MAGNYVAHSAFSWFFRGSLSFLRVCAVLIPEKAPHRTASLAGMPDLSPYNRRRWSVICKAVFQTAHAELKPPLTDTGLFPFVDHYFSANRRTVVPWLVHLVRHVSLSLYIELIIQLLYNKGLKIFNVNLFLI